MADATNGAVSVSDTTAAIIIAVIGAIASVWAGVARFWAVRERDRLRVEKDLRLLQDRSEVAADKAAAGFREELREEIHRLREETRTLQQDGRELRSEIHKLETTNGLLRMEITSLNIRIMELTTMLKHAGMTPPDWKAPGS